MYNLVPEFLSGVSFGLESLVTDNEEHSLIFFVVKFLSLRWCSKANWYWDIMGSCHLCLVSTWSFFLKWWKDGACCWHLEHSIKFFYKGKATVLAASHNCFTRVLIHLLCRGKSWHVSPHSLFFISNYLKKWKLLREP